MYAEKFRYYAGWIDKFTGDSFARENDGGFMTIVRNEPLGVAAGILPWNAPIILGVTRPLLPW
jgi:aldehyde dehydrogenase (NAD+)